jgi:hypothetical protein
MTETGPVSKMLCMKTPKTVSKKTVMFIVTHHNQEHFNLVQLFTPQLQNDCFLHMHTHPCAKGCSEEMLLSCLNFIYLPVLVLRFSQ